MPSTYTVNLGIEKPATGEQSGTWGDTTNVNFDILDQAVNGAARVTLTSAGSSGSPNTLAITNGATSDGRNKWVEFYSSSDLGGNVFVQLDPNDAEKIVFVRNSLGGSQSILLFQGTYNSGRDLEIPAGVDMVVKFDGGGASAATVTDVYTKLRATEITTPTLTAGTADINGGTLDGSVIGGASAAAITGTTVVANTSLNIAGDGATVTGIKDEDDMASNSATKLATQQSIKAYVDSQVGTVDTLAEILANGNTTGGNDIVFSAGDNITNASGDLTIDVVGDIILDADGGDILLKDGGNDFGRFSNSSQDFVIRNSVSDKDIIFRGNDNSVAVDALLLDMSDAGTAIFNHDIQTGLNAFMDIRDADGDISGRLRNVSGSNNALTIEADPNNSASGSYMNFKVDTGTAMTIDSSQRVLIGTNTARADLFNTTATAALQVEGTTGNTSAASIVRNSNDDNGPQFILGKSNGTSVGSDTIVTDNALLGRVSYQGADGSELVEGARIESQVDGTPGANDMPGRLQFYTTADGASSPTERMRINNAGKVRIGSGDPSLNLEVVGSGDQFIFLQTSTSSDGLYIKADSGGDGTEFQTAGGQDKFGFRTNGTLAATIDSSQRVLIGGQTTARSTFSSTTSGGVELSVEGTNADNSKIATVRNTDGVNGPYLVLGKTRASAVNGVTQVVNGDQLGSLSFQGADGVQMREAALIRGEVDGAVDGSGAADMPGRIIFATTPDGSVSATERMRINSSGMVIINNGNVSTGAGTNKALLQVANIDTTSDWTAINTGANGYASTANEIAVLNTANQDLNGFAGIFLQAGENSNGSSINSARIGAIKTSTSGTSTDLGFATRDSSAVMAERMRITSNGGIIFQGPTPAGSTAIASGTLGPTNTFAELAGSGGSGAMVLSRATTSNDAEIGTLRFVNRTNASDSGLGSTGRAIASMSVKSVTSDSNAGADSGSTMKFFTKPEAGSIAERLTIASGGNVTVQTGNLIIGTAGKGIDFSAQTATSATGASTDSELLDHYEEGTWQPTVKGSSSAGTATGYTARTGFYTRIGNIVQIHTTIAVNGLTGTGSLLVSGLPFNTSNASVDSVFSMQWNSAQWSGPTSTKQTVIPMIFATNGDKLGFRASDYQSGYAFNQVTCVSGATIEYMRITGWYRLGTT